MSDSGKSQGNKNNPMLTEAEPHLIELLTLLYTFVY